MSLLANLFGRKKQKLTAETAAEAIGLMLFIGASKDSEIVASTLQDLLHPKPNNTRSGNVFVEMLHFYLNLTDRIAFKHLDSQTRAQFFDQVAAQVYKNHLEGFRAAGGDVDDETFFRIFEKTLWERQEEYGNYKIGENPVGFKGTLFWEFEKRLVGIYGANENFTAMLGLHAILLPLAGKYMELCDKTIPEITT